MTRDDALSKLLPLARDVSVIAFAALVLGFATMLGWQALAFVCGVAAALLFFLLQQTRAVPRRDWLLLFILGGWLLVPTVERLSQVSVFAMWQPALMLLSVLGMARFAAELRESGWLRLALAFFFMYLMFGIVSTSVIGRTRTLAGLYQFISDLKPMLFVMLGYALRWDDRMERWLWIVVRWAWLPMLVCVAFEWVAPGTFFKVLYGGRWGPSSYPFGLVPSRALGLFDHPSFLATTSAVFVLLIAGRACADHADHQERTHRWVALGGIYGVLLLCSIQRQEMAALAVALAVVALLSRPDRIGRRLVAIALAAVPITAGLAMLLAEPITEELATWGIGSRLSIENPRAQIFLGGFEVAQRLWPFGSGLGTYGGAGAEKFDQSLYHELGFRYYWWFGKQDFLMDTYWPNPIAEKGILGAVCLLLCYVALFFFAAKRAVSATQLARTYWLAAAGMMVYMLLLSFTSPAFQDPRLFLLPATMFGIASQCTNRKALQKERPRAWEVAR